MLASSDSGHSPFIHCMRSKTSFGKELSLLIGKHKSILLVRPKVEWYKTTIHLSSDGVHLGFFTSKWKWRSSLNSFFRPPLQQLGYWNCNEELQKKIPFAVRFPLPFVITGIFTSKVMAHEKHIAHITLMRWGGFLVDKCNTDCFFCLSWTRSLWLQSQMPDPLWACDVDVYGTLVVNWILLNCRVPLGSRKNAANGVREAPRGMHIFGKFTYRTFDTNIVIKFTHPSSATTKPANVHVASTACWLFTRPLSQWLSNLIELVWALVKGRARL